MKKLLVILVAVSLLFAMSSCKKTCTCTVTAMGVTTTTEVNLKDYENYDVKKCSDLGSANIPGMVSYDCK